MILIILIFLASGRLEKLQYTITEKVRLEIGRCDQNFIRLWQKIEQCHWEREYHRWVIFDSLSRTQDQDKVNQLLKEMVRIDSIYAEKISSLIDSLKYHLPSGQAKKFIQMRKNIGPKLKDLIREIKSDED
jgi:hypothetical protein